MKTHRLIPNGTGLVIAVWIISILIVHVLWATWPSNPSVNVPISTATSDQNSVVVASDNGSRYVIAWKDFRSGSSWDIYAQSVDAQGNIQWTANGIAICTGSGDTYWPDITGDGADGAIIVWADTRNNLNADIYAQRVAKDGTVQWTTNGVPVAVKNNNLAVPRIVSDGAGGAIIVWWEQNSATYAYDIYAQRVNSTGATQWTSEGVAVCAATGNQRNFDVIADGNGGVFVVWEDERNTGTTDTDIYAQHINSSGTAEWTTNGVAVCTATDAQELPKLTGDGTGGIIVTWVDNRNGNSDIYAQKLDATGLAQWTAQGVAVCTNGESQQRVCITGDGNQGAYICWTDSRELSHTYIYGQRVNSTGVQQWQTDGIRISNNGMDADYARMVSDLNNGAIVMYNAFPGSGTDIYVQKLNASGTLVWGSTSVAVNVGTNIQEYTGDVVTDFAGGAVVAWEDNRNTSDDDVYAQRVFQNGTIYGASGNEVIINEYDGDVAKGGEWIELLVVKSGGVDLRNWILTDEDPDHMSSPVGEGVYSFADDPLFQNVPQGTYIVVEIGSGTDDTDWSDGNLKFYTSNSMLVHQSGVFDLDDAADNITLWYDDDGIWDEDNSIGVDHISYGVFILPPAWVTWNTAITGSKGTNGNEAYFSNGSSFDNDDAGNWVASQSHTPGAVNPGQDDSSLPIELISFNGRYESGRVLLHWVTASEMDNAGFEIYRATGKETIYRLISSYRNNTSLQGAGNSPQPREYSYADGTVLPGKTYWYKLADVSSDGQRTFHREISVLVPEARNRVLRVSENIPGSFLLYPNYPNPFNPSTTIQFDLPFTENRIYPVTLEIYNPIGERVRTLYSGELAAGSYRIVWDGTNEYGQIQPTGVYFYRLQAGHLTSVQKMLLMR